MVGNGAKNTFWNEPWMDGKSPKDIAPLIFEVSKRKNWKVAQALFDGAWVKKINLEGHFSWEHLTQFVNLWVF
jgi:hypothetical protein